MPVITISRGTFSGGLALAQCISDRLGIACVSREVLADAAEASGLPLTDLSEAVEKPPAEKREITSIVSLHASEADLRTAVDSINHAAAAAPRMVELLADQSKAGRRFSSATVASSASSWLC